MKPPTLSLSIELTQPHSNFSLRLIPSRCTEKRFKLLFVSTAIQMYSASCHSGFSLSQPSSRALQPRCLTLSPSVSPDCFSLLLWSALLSTSTLSAWFWPAGSTAYFCTHLCTSQNITVSLMNCHNVHKLLPFVIIISSDCERSYCNSYFLF